MSNICDFGRILKTECSSLHFTINCGIKNLDDFEADEADMYLWRAGHLNMKWKGMTICYHREQVFGNVFARRESNCCGVLTKHCRKVKGDQHDRPKLCGNFHQEIR